VRRHAPLIVVIRDAQWGFRPRTTGSRFRQTNALLNSSRREAERVKPFDVILSPVGTTLSNLCPVHQGLSSVRAILSMSSMIRKFPSWQANS
jgi:hypothetical protein